MFPAKCDYYRATSAAEAIDLLGRHDNARLLAGGHSLIPMMKLRLCEPAALIDIGRLEELRGVSENDIGDNALRIGALSTHTEIATSETLRTRCSLLAEAARQIGDPQVRNKGTIGGNIAHADPASDLPAVLVALGATIHILGPNGERSIAAPSFFTDLLTTALEPNEIVTTIEVPVAPPGSGSAYLKVEHPASGYAVCGAAATMTIEGSSCTAASLAFNGVAATPVHAEAVTAALAGTAADDSAFRAAVDAHLEIAEPLGDLHASGEYRVALAKVYGRRALEKARDRALS
ncbi:MAG: xanthine dehydrogenase family protein subunit M [Acidobacteriota bacterium]|nr:xanthine dehydrogenase family protein subunit M [Acidobacteriota bacterium]